MAKILMIVAIVIAVIAVNMSHVEGQPQRSTRDTACKSDDDCTKTGERCCWWVLAGNVCTNTEDVLACISPNMAKTGGTLISQGINEAADRG